MKKIILPVFALSFLLVLTSCGGNGDLKTDLLGSWKVTEMSEGDNAQEMPEGMEMTFTFAEEGKLVASMSMGDMNQDNEGTWEVKGASNLVLTLDEKPMESTATLDGDNLSIEGEADGKKITFKLERVKNEDVAEGEGEETEMNEGEGEETEMGEGEETEMEEGDDTEMEEGMTEENTTEETEVETAE